MSGNDNFTDFMMNILQGIGYGKLSSTNRAYNWIRKHNSIAGPCLTFLKNNLSTENFITLKEMNSFKDLEKQGNLPSEDEIDKLLSEYINETSVDTFHLTEARYIENESKQSSQYYEALELEEKFLERQCNKLQEEISVLETRAKIDEKKLNSASAYAEEVTILYNNAVKEVQQDLSGISNTFEKLINEDEFVEKYNILGMNFETFKDINKTFREAVNTAIEKQFSKTSSSDTLFQNESGQIDFNCVTLMPSDQKYKMKKLISLAERLGQCNYQHLKLKCEETELSELSNYIEELLNSPEYRNINLARIKAKTDENFDITYDLQKKIIPLAEVLEKHYNTFVLKTILVDTRSHLERNLKADRKCLQKISDLCVKFVDLMTLQSCLSRIELQNFDWAISAFNHGQSTLENHLQNHKFNINNLKKMLDHQQKVLLHDQSRDSLSRVIGAEGQADISDVQNALVNISTLQNNIMAKINNRLKQFLHVSNQIDRINEVIFNGPLCQAFFYDTLLKDELLIMRQCSTLQDQYNFWKLKFNEESEKLKTNKYEKLIKSLGVMFLTNPEALKNQFSQLKQQLTDKKTLSNTIAGGVKTDPESSVNALSIKRGNLSTF